jgi:hypothetical protein
LQAILREIVNDLERTTATLGYLEARLASLSEISLANRQDSVALHAKTNKEFYAGLRKKIDALK